MHPFLNSALFSLHRSAQRRLRLWGRQSAARRFFRPRFESLEDRRLLAVTIHDFVIPTANSHPFGIVAGPDGNIWFTEQGGKIGRMNLDGGVTAEFSVPNTIPLDITVGADGNLWFVGGSGRIGRMTPTGGYTEFSGGTLGFMHGIAAGPDGNLWATGYGNGRIGKITTSGVLTVYTLPSGNSAPTGIVAGPDGNLWFTLFDANKIGRITPAGSFTEFPLPIPNRTPTYITVGSDGNLWFTEESAGRIGRMTTTGTLTEFPVPTTNGGPYGIAAGPDGNLWFTYTRGNKIGRITTSGVVTEFVLPTPGPPIGGWAYSSNMITAGPDGNLWFTQEEANKIGRVTLHRDIVMLSAELQDPGTVQFTFDTLDIKNAFEVGLYLSADQTFDPASDVLIGSFQTITAVGGQETASISLPPVTPDPVRPYLLVVADPLAVVHEEDADPWNEDNLASLLHTPIIDTVPPRITAHTPGGDIAGSIGAIDVWFSERVNKTTFQKRDVTVIRPDNQMVAATSIQEVGLNRFRITFPTQTQLGTYHVHIGPDIHDFAANRLDQDRDGLPGEPGQDVYDATFHLVQVDLGLSNLVVGAGQLTAGELVEVSWQGMNRTGAPLQGDWLDAVYLSTDDRWDINDARLAIVPHTGGLAANETYSGSATVAIPGRLPANYHILVRADIANQERETNEADNLIASPPFPLTFHTLIPGGEPAVSALTPTDRADYYAITVAPGDGLRLSLSSPTPAAVNELYISRNAIPTRQSFDHRAAAGGPDQQLVLTGDIAGGTFYVLAHGAQIPDITEYTLTGDVSPVAVDAITPQRHGNSQSATVTLTGAGFDNATTVQFIGEDDAIHLPTDIRLISPSTMTLQLDLPTWPAGNYRVRVVEPAGSDELPEPFVVTQGGTARLETNLVIPSALGFLIPIRQTIWIEYRNAGDAPMPAPLLQLKGSHDVRITADRALAIPFRGYDGAPAGVTDTVEVLGLGSSATPWLLQPGESARLPIYYIGLGKNHGYPRITFNLGVLTADDRREIDWADQEDFIRPVNITDEEWSRLFRAIRIGIGPTWGGYVRALGTPYAVEDLESDDVLSVQLAGSIGISSAWSGFVSAASSLLPTWLVQLFTDYQGLPNEINYPDIPLLESPPDPLYFACRDTFNEVWTDVYLQDAALDLVTAREEILEYTVLDVGFVWLGKVSRITFNIASTLAAAGQLRSAFTKVDKWLGLQTNPAPFVITSVTRLGANITNLGLFVESMWNLGKQAFGAETPNSSRSLLQELVGFHVESVDAIYTARDIALQLSQSADDVEGLSDAIGILAGFNYLLNGGLSEDVDAMVNAASRVIDDALAFTVAKNDYELKVHIANTHLNEYITCRANNGGDSDGDDDGDGDNGENGNGDPGDGGDGNGGDDGGSGGNGGGGGGSPGQGGTPQAPYMPGPGGNTGGAGSFDPNDKLAPTGAGEAAFIQATGKLSYQIRFENKPDATAPARLMTVTDPLDANLDLSTFELTEIVFANHTIAIPAGLDLYTDVVPLTTPTGANISVQVQAELEHATRTLSLQLDAFDPLTGYYSEDPFVGLLYPNDETGRGEGSISYLVRPKAGLPSGTVIENRARIVFDFNDPIDTPLVRNTLDAAAPTSVVASLPTETLDRSFTVMWAGADDAGGSGVAGYDLYVSDNGGPFVVVLAGANNTSLEFTGVAGHTYAFYTVARDHVGHVEAPPLTPDAVISIALPDVAGPEVLDLVEVTPDPRAMSVEAVEAVFSEPLDLTTLDAADVILRREGVAIPLSGLVFEELGPAAGYAGQATAYRIGGLGAFTQADGAYELRLEPAGLADLAGNPGVGSAATEAWLMDATPPAAPMQLAIAPDTGRFTNDAVTKHESLTLSGSLSESGLMVRVHNVTRGVDFGLAAVTGATFQHVLLLDEGEHQLRVVAEDAAGNSAEAFLTVVVDRTAPRVDALETPAGPRTTPVDTLDVTFETALDPTTFDWRALSLRRNGGAELITSAVTVTQLTELTYRISGLASLTALRGSYELRLEACELSDLAGNAGVGAASVSWQNVSLWATATSLESAPSPSQHGQPVTLTARVTHAADDGSTPAGSVTFRRGLEVLGVRPLDATGVAQLTVSSLGVGPHTLTAEYSGDTSFAGGLSNGLTHTVEAVGVRDVTAQMNLVLSGFRYNRTTRRWAQTVSVTNTSGQPLAGPVSLVLGNLSSNALLIGPTGYTSQRAPLGSPYRDLLPDLFALNQTITLTLEFDNPTNAAITYQARVLAGPGTR